MTDGENRLVVGVLTGDPSLPYAYGVDGRFAGEEWRAVTHVLAALERMPEYLPRHLGDHGRLIDELRHDPPDLVLNFCDTGYRNLLANEANVPALLELLDIPYTGAGAAAMHLCADKAMVRLAAAAHGIPVPNEILVDLGASPLPRSAVYPAIIKPNAGCGSQGVTRECVVHDAVEARARLRRLAEETDWARVLIQDFLTGDEYTVGLIGNPEQGLTVLPPLVVDYSGLEPGLPPILTYGSKVDPDSPYWQALRFREADLDSRTHARLIEHSTWLFERLGLRDYARIDFRAGADGVPRLIDANFNPTWSHDGKLAMMAAWSGLDYDGLLRAIIEAARTRYGL